MNYTVLNEKSDSFIAEQFSLKNIRFFCVLLTDLWQWGNYQSCISRDPHSQKLVCVLTDKDKVKAVICEDEYLIYNVDTKNSYNNIRIERNLDRYVEIDKSHDSYSCVA